MSKKFNSINDKSAIDIRNNENVIELLTKIDQALTSTESFITANTIDTSGNQVSTQIPTIGSFNQKLEQIFQYVKKLSGIDGNPASLQVGSTTKRIITTDLNNEPKQISAVNTISTFKSDPNWIFDSFLNPKISVEIDLTGKINDSCKTIQSKRYIVDFDKIVTPNADGTDTVTLTPDGQLRKNEFLAKYNKNSNIDISEFTGWLETPGLINKTDLNYIDQDYFRIEPTRLNYKGNFSILSTEIDTVNKKLWYILDSLTYYDVSILDETPTPVELKIGDTITITPNSNGDISATIYKVVEISTITSEYRVRFELVFGTEPIPIRLNAISIYSNTIPTRTAKISVGFEEYCVIFVKAIDDTSNIISTYYSPGTGFYTPDLRLDNSNGELLSDYYISKVYDYGIALEDLVAKKIPNIYGEAPNAPVLNIDNFKVVQINEHLTQTVEAEKIRDLHNQKNNIASKIIQVQNSILKESKMIQTEKFNSDADKKNAQTTLATLNSQLENFTKSKTSIISEILANKKNLNKISPIYHARGFFPMPVAKKSTKTKPQEVVQFEIWYRKLSKSNAENPILTIQDIDNQASKQASILNTNTLSNLSKPNKINATFSNWTKYRTDARKRVQDPITGDWFWEIVDVTDANTPNINQIDLPILPGEKIEIKIKSLSEVGFPDTPLESEFSNTLEIPFPDDLNSVLNEDDFLLKEAQIDEMRVNFDKDLETMGLKAHLNSSIQDSEIYYAHTANSIASGFKDSSGKMVNLYDYINTLLAKITSLEENISRSKGLLEVYLIINGNKTRIYNGNNLSFNINLEEYMTKTKIGLIDNPVDSVSRTYKNELLVISDYSIQIKNAAESASLGLLAFRGYGAPSGLRDSTFAYDGNAPEFFANGTSPGTPTSGNYGIQALWLDPAFDMLTKLDTNFDPIPPLGNTADLNYTTNPRFRTQINNQFVWLQNKDVSGNYIYNGSSTQPSNNLYNANATVNGAVGIHKILTSKNYNVGLFANLAAYVTPALPITNITDNKNWNILQDITTPGTVLGDMATTIHPQIDSLESITDISTEKIKILKPGDPESLNIPIKIFAKAFTGTGVSSPSNNNNTAFIDNDYTPTGDMPVILDEVKKNAFNNLVIKYTGTSIETKIKENDRVVIDGFTTITGANKKVLTVLSCIGNELVLKYTDPLLTDTFTSDGIPKIVQIHKRYVQTNTQLVSYNVLGQVGSDERYVNNYVEISSNPTSSSTPIIHTKKLRMYLEEETSARPFEFELTFNITQYKPALFTRINQNISLLGG